MTTLILDCDGVLADTEQFGHLPAFNATFRELGLPVQWSVELGAPSGLARQGWVPKTVTPGMNVKVLIHPLRDGHPGGQFLHITLPDGKQLGDPSTRGRVQGEGGP